MSRVRDALKKASLPQPAEAGSPENLPKPRPLFNVPAESPKDTIFFHEPEEDEETSEFRIRWLWRAFGLFGLNRGGSVSTCGGVTGVGELCKGLAMANGYCRRKLRRL